ncbi:replication-relaxation family protein [Paramaledivibacter caminithermalis]|uniref:Replication-relaxation n=1 Tax=Paramaledivibacter caminithermalis (strain DSM 15212 / CIP 107654 / DViRD3) TaxID=1121301 RepID=A0A1M6SS02_PARC5|nr:replication-relaxation family protein [Paramaledivibacter caminithermalis]SHK47493.1 Replication-relaxation [Paramaledivibacter caminithermalis DSM 15212]
MIDERKYKKGTRRRERVEIKGNPYNHLMNYPMNEVKEKIIYFLYDMRAAKTSQLARYLGYSSPYIRKILRDLYENRLVYRDFPTISRKKHGSSEGIYFLDNQGAFFIAADNGLEKKDVSWDPRDNVVSLGAIKHTLDITEIRTCMEEKSNDIRIDEFIGERKHGMITFESQGEEITFNPDSKISLIKKVGDKLARVTFFLEYDRNTESLRSFLEKIRVYERFYKSEKFKRLFGSIHPAILIITNHERRTEKLKDLVKENKIENIKYYFDTLNEDFRENPFKFLDNQG